MDSFQDFACDIRLGKIFRYETKRPKKEVRRFVVDSYRFLSAENLVYPWGTDLESGEELNILQLLYSNRIVGYHERMGSAVYVSTILRSKMRTEMQERMKRYADLMDVGRFCRAIIVGKNDMYVRTFSDQIIPMSQYSMTARFCY